MVTPSHRSAVPWVVAAALTVVVAGYLFVIHDDWYLTFDGSAYLYLADQLLEGSLRFPDGSFGSARGPGFPLFLAGVGTIVDLDPRSAIWAVRALLVVNAALIGLFAAYARNLVAGVVAGLVAATQALPLLSGGLFLIPDGLAMGLLMAALLITCVAPTNRVAVCSAGGLAGVAFLTKETAGLALVMLAALLITRGGNEPTARVKHLAALLVGWSSPILVWSWILVGQGEAALPPFPSSMAALVGLAALLATGLVLLRSERPVAVTLGGWGRLGAVLGWSALVLGLLVVSAAPSLFPAKEVAEAVRNDLRRWLYPGQQIWPLWVVVGGAAVASALDQRRDSLAGALLVSTGAASLIHASSAGLGLRNGLLLSYGLALAVGLAAGRAGVGSALRVLRSGALLACAYLVLLNLPAWSHANDLLNERAHTWDAPVVVAAANWLANQDGAVVGTPTFLSHMARLNRPSSYGLVRFYAQQADDDPYVDPFTSYAGWLGSVSVEPTRGELVTLTVGRRNQAAILTDQLAEDLLAADLVVLSGNLVTIGSILDGGVLLERFADDPNLLPVYVTEAEGLPHWIAIFSVSGPLEDGPAIVHDVVGRHEPRPDELVFDLPSYQAMILESLERARVRMASNG